MVKVNEDGVVYSETIEISNLEEENKELSENVQKLEEENRVINSSLNKLEQESALLRELFNNTNEELNNLKKPALLVSDVVSVHDDKAIIRLPNGNKFYCYVSQNIEEIKSGDVSLVDQKSLNIVDKIEISGNFEVEKYIIV